MKRGMLKKRKIMWLWLLIMGGGAIGSLFRYGVSTTIYRCLGTGFPFGILAVNIVGSCLMGFLSICFLEKTIAESVLRPLLLVGFLGGFTTFSSFSLDAVQLLQTGQLIKAAAYMILSVGLSISAAFVGIWLGRVVTGL